MLPFAIVPLAVAVAISFAFSMFTIYGVGPETALWGLLAVLAGIPLYAVIQVRPS